MAHNQELAGKESRAYLTGWQWTGELCNNYIGIAWYFGINLECCWFFGDWFWNGGMCIILKCSHIHCDSVYQTEDFLRIVLNNIRDFEFFHFFSAKSLKKVEKTVEIHRGNSRKFSNF